MRKKTQGGPVLLTLTVLAALAVLTVPGCAQKTGPRAYDFAVVSRGVLEKTVSASGSLKPLSIVSVLPRMSGKVERVYVDYNHRVRRGDILAELNTDTLKLKREQQMAQVIKARANYELQLINYQNQERLAEKNLISEYEFKTGKTTLDILGAELSAAEASLRVIETEINEYAYIASPIDGIVLEKNISEGTTVVEGSSSNAASVFTLAENLEEMRIEAGVGELDITSIFEGQEVRFTLESIPGRTYPGTVAAIYLMPTVTNNVVSYTVIINVDNRDGSLLPGMTCAVEFIAARSEGILLVPNAALRYQPSALSAGEVEDRVFAAGLRGLDEAGRAAALAARAEAQARSQPQGGVSPGANPSMGLAGLAGGGQRMAPGMGASGPPRVPGIPAEMVRGGGANRSGPSSSVPTGSVSSSSVPNGRGGAPLKTLWYLDGAGKPDCIMVIPGLSDGSYTEVAPADGGAGLEGTRVITRERL